MQATTAFWAMTINNYDETDLAMVQNGYPDYMRELVYTLERGTEGTPHIQAYIKLQRQQRLSFVKKLFPRGHFKPLCSDEYVHNTKLYAQKTDETTQSSHAHRFNDPMATIESTVRRVIYYMIDNYESEPDLPIARRCAERDLVREDYKLAKIFVSSTYKSMWKEFGHEMYENIFHTHTHTHSHEKFSHDDTITDASVSDQD